MGCRHSAAKEIRRDLTSVAGKQKLSFRSAQLKACLSTKTTCVRETAFHLERILDGHGAHLKQRLELDSAGLLFDLSPTHILVLDDRRLRLLNMNTMNVETQILPSDSLDIQDIAWSSQLAAFLLLSTDRVYQTRLDGLNLKVIDQIQVRPMTNTREVHLHI